MKNIIGNMEHIGYRRNCSACRLYCLTCGNKARDKPDGEFLTEKEVGDYGSYCKYDCKGSKLENNRFCYHCKKRVNGNEAFCGKNCFKNLFKRCFSPVSLRSYCEM